MPNYYRLMLGAKSAYATECFEGNFVGVDFDVEQDLMAFRTENWREFNRACVPLYLKAHPAATKIGAGLACGALWTLSVNMQVGDRVLCPDGSGFYHVAEITGDYVYAGGHILPHRRPVRWLDVRIARSAMSEALQASTRVGLTVVGPNAITAHKDEIERLTNSGADSRVAGVSDPTVEDEASFVLEKHLEDFLIRNWSRTELGAEFDIYEEDGETGQQFLTDTGPLDILAVSKDRRRLLVVELKKGRASDAVVGQILRYMGYIREELAEANQEVHGAIIAHEDDQRIRRALMMTPNVSFYRYEVSFRLVRS